MPTVSDVARRAAVSPGIVSRLLNGDETLRIREATRVRVLEAASALDYSPNNAARALRRSRSGVLGLAVHDASNPVYSEIIAGAQAAANAAGYALMLADVDALATDDSVFKRVMSSGAIDGLLLQRAGTKSDGLVSRVASGRVPTVLLNDRTRGPIGSIAVDDFAGAKLATEHLIELGHERIALLQVDGPTSRSDRRRRGWEAAIRAAGLTTEERLIVVGGHTADSGAEAMKALLSASAIPTAVFAANILAAVGAMSAAIEAGLSIPGELSVIGLHDFSLASHLNPALTAVRLPLRAMGARAVEMLLAGLEDGQVRHESISAPHPRLVLRRSTAAPL